MNARRQPLFFRRAFVFGLLAVTALLLGWRAVHLQVLNKDFLRGQGEARYSRVVSVVAHRGMILDRHGDALAASTPVDSVWANPKEFRAKPGEFRKLAALLEIPVESITHGVYDRPNSEFAYLKRQISPEVGQRVLDLRIPGVALQREYRRYYPAGEVAAHVLGFTDIDDKGQEGLELGFDATLRGANGKRRIIRDNAGRAVEAVESVLEPEPGRDVALSIDRRLQYLAYRELKAAVQKHQARAGSVVVLDVRTGEVLAMVNAPSFNPNNRDELHGPRCRNRSVTDLFEPGSTIKPFSIAAALQTGHFKPSTLIDTAPGTFRVGNALVRDTHNFGLIDVATVLQKSSNVGVSKLALETPPEKIWQQYVRAGLGVKSGTEFPGEVAGVLNHYSQWREVERVTASYGYGLSVTTLQLARAYAALADDGRLRKITFTRVEDATQLEPPVDQLMSPQMAVQIRHMMETVAEDGGTGTLARVPGYRIAGKTGTAKKIENGAYTENTYRSLFAGFAPARDPRLAMVVVIDEPQGRQYYGGEVAAPVFGGVMAGALRLLNVAPDDVPSPKARLALAAGGAR
jgi:cell division protein FtsI (penicillin-binding protein 3)